MTNEIATTSSTARSLSMNELAANGEHAVKTGMLPEHIKTGWQFAVIAATGHELGMQPMRAIRSLAMVKGRVVEAADSQLARFKAAGGRSQFEVLDESQAVLHLIHPNGDKHKEVFTIEDAKRAGLTSSQTYQKFPKAMLRSRAITAGLKSLGWEGAVGTYDPDEVRGEEFPVTMPEPAAEPVVFRPKDAPEAKGELDPVKAAEASISKAKSLDALDRLRNRITEREAAGVFTADQAAALTTLCKGKAEEIIGREEATNALA